MEQPHQARRHAAIFAVQVGLNALIGYAFARVLAHRMGVGAEKDAFDMAYAIPFLILKLCGFALIHGVATTRFTRLRLTASPAHASEAFSTMLTSMLLAAVVLTAGCCVWSESLVRLLGPGLPPTAQLQMERLLWSMVPLTFVLGVGTFLSGVLIAYGSPLSSEFPQIASRVAALAWIWLCGDGVTFGTIAAGLTWGAVVAVVYQGWVLVQRTPIRFQPVVDWRNPEFRGIVRQVPGLIASAILAQAAFLCMQRLATLEGPGTVSRINYALFIVSPLSLLVGKPLCLAFGPRCASLLAQQRHADAMRHTLALTAVVLAMTVPFSMLIGAHAETVIGVLYGGGMFDAAAVASTARICRIAVWAIPAAVIYWIMLIPILSIRRSEFSGLLLSVGHAVQIVLSYVLYARFAAAGLVWAYVIGISAQACIALVVASIIWIRLADRTEAARGLSPSH